ncbi:MAG: triose-phosphate isomerase [Chloroflexi bacterium]|nr:triose-phosphate isomerase [Chloroflexota bacterium]MBU1750925.1 triose-phosphate isomerase [Chloroflexota bacterium]
MRIPIIAGNWKMNTNVDEAIRLVESMLDGLEAVPGVERVLCPPFVSLTYVSDLLVETSIRLGAQNMYPADKGAYTGEISPGMLKGLCQYVILGHSERRQYFGETDEFVNRKVHTALTHDLVPIICIGETLAENEAGQTAAVVTRQARGVLAGLNGDQVSRVVMAYEPIWAIGTGRPATGEGANQVIGLIREVAAGLAGPGPAQALRIQYGGSVTGDNAAEFMGQPEIDGALVGGASLKADQFVRIVQTTAQAKGV